MEIKMIVGLLHVLVYIISESIEMEMRSRRVEKIKQENEILNDRAGDSPGRGTDQQ